MKKIYLLFTLLAGTYIGAHHAQAQVTNLAGTTVTILAGTNVTLLQNLTNNGTFTGNAGAPNSKLIMAGAAEQLIDGSTVVDLADFQVNNGGNGTTIGNTVAVRVGGELSLTNGKVFASDLTPIRFAVNATINPIENVANHIVGTAIMESRNVGVGAFTQFLGFAMAAGGNVGTLTLTRKSGNGAGNTLAPAPTTGIVNPVGFQSIAAHWIVDVATNQDRSITVSWNSAWNNSKNLAQMQLWHTASPFTTASPWIVMNNTPVDMNSLSHTALSGTTALRNGWTVSDVVSPLPVELLYFSAKEQNKNALLNWQTIVETNTASFDVERSVDGENFEKIGNVSSKRPLANEIASYNFIDKNLYDLNAENVYYRLKMIDNDNSFKYSKKESIKTNNTSENIGIFPNPFSDNISIKINLAQTQDVSIKITDVLGREVYAYNNNLQNISLELNKELSDLAKGAYFVHISTENTQKTVKIIKQ